MLWDGRNNLEGKRDCLYLSRKRSEESRGGERIKGGEDSKKRNFELPQ